MKNYVGCISCVPHLQAGVEGAIHTLSIKSWDWVGSSLVDAKNAFNSLNRAAALWNARVQWPCCSCFSFNTYHGYASLILERHSSSYQ